MPKLRPEDIKEFKGMWRRERGEEIDDARAEELARRLLNIVRFAIESTSEGRSASSRTLP